MLSLSAFSFKTGLVPSGDPSKLGWPDFIKLISNVIGLMSYIAIAIATLGVIWGGVTLLISAGNESKIKEGKGIIKASLIGYAIVLGAGAIITGIFAVLGIDSKLLPW